MRAQYKSWEFEYDPEKTADLYKSIEMPASLECGCDPCKNFALAKATIYPAEILNLFSKLGIEMEKEVYLVHTARKQPGLHYYSGAHVCFGRILVGNPISQKQTLYERVNDTYSILIDQTVSLPSSPIFDRYKSELFQLNFFVLVPWVLAHEPEPTYG